MPTFPQNLVSVKIQLEMGGKSTSLHSLVLTQGFQLLLQIQKSHFLSVNILNILRVATTQINVQLPES